MLGRDAGVAASVSVGELVNGDRLADSADPVATPASLPLSAPPVSGMAHSLTHHRAQAVPHSVVAYSVTHPLFGLAPYDAQATTLSAAPTVSVAPSLRRSDAPTLRFSGSAITRSQRATYPEVADNASTTRYSTLR
jgi:hypothetical protein